MKTEAQIACLFTEMKQSSRLGAADLIAFPDCRNIRMLLTPFPSREISSNFQLGIEIYAPERRRINLSADQQKLRI